MSEKSKTVEGKFGKVHADVLEKVRRMSYREARKWLREMGFSHAEQDELISAAKRAGNDEARE